jgi:cell division septum initiation protein DivIVA
VSITPQQSASVRLSAQPTAKASGDLPPFAVVTRGYDRQQVEDWVREKMKEVEHLGQRLAAFAGHEAKSPEGRKLMVEVLQIVADEAAGKQQAADEEISQMLSGAQEQAATILEDARRQAADSNASAAQQANSLINGARADAKRTRDEAEAYAAAVHEAAGARMNRIVQIHRDTLDRIDQVYKVTGQTLTAEQQRGPIEDEVASALAPITPLQQQRLLVAFDVFSRPGDPAPGTGVVHQAIVPVLAPPPVHGLPHDRNAFMFQHFYDLLDARAQDSP